MEDNTMNAVLPTTSQETPVFFPAGQETLFGILTSPTVEAIGSAVIFLPTGGLLPSPNRNRLAVRFCRRLASEGYHAMRFDYRGVGESTGVARHLRLDEPFVDDVEGAIRWIQGQGIGKYVLVGSCFGARTALAWARRANGVQGIVLISAPVSNLGARSAAEWAGGEYPTPRLRLQALRRLAMVNPDFLEPLADLVERRVPILFVYGTSDRDYEEFQRSRDGRLGTILKRGGSRIEVKTLTGRLHGFPQLGPQDAVIELISKWLHRQRAAAGVRSS
jgi:pimeloyl-ACP methyl ester carboxylesterase